MDTRLTLRLTPELRAFLKTNAGQAGISLSAFVKNALARGLEEEGLHNELKSFLTTLVKSSENSVDKKSWHYALEALAEIRALLRSLATARDASLVTQAKQLAKKDLAALMQEKQ